MCGGRSCGAHAVQVDPTEEAEACGEVGDRRAGTEALGLREQQHARDRQACPDADLVSVRSLVGTGYLRLEPSIDIQGELLRTTEEVAILKTCAHPGSSEVVALTYHARFAEK